MKKIYEAPQFFTVQLATQQMLALSQGGEYSQGQPTLAPGYGRNKDGKYDPNYDEEEDEEDW
jgi:hypothetical protein